MQCNNASKPEKRVCQNQNISPPSTTPFQTGNGKSLDPSPCQVQKPCHLRIKSSTISLSPPSVCSWIEHWWHVGIMLGSRLLHTFDFNFGRESDIPTKSTQNTFIKNSYNLKTSLVFLSLRLQAKLVFVCAQTRLCRLLNFLYLQNKNNLLTDNESYKGSETIVEIVLKRSIKMAGTVSIF